MRPFTWGFFRGFRGVAVWGWTAGGGQVIETIVRAITHIFVKDTKRREFALDIRKRIFVLDAKRREFRG